MQMHEMADNPAIQIAVGATDRGLNGERFLADSFDLEVYTRDAGDEWSHRWEQYLDGGIKSFEDVFTLEKINIIGVVLDNYGKAKYLQYEYMTPYLPDSVSRRLNLNKWSRDIMMVPNAESEELGVQIAKYWIVDHVLAAREQLREITDPTAKHRSVTYFDLDDHEKLEVLRYGYHLGNHPGSRCVGPPAKNTKSIIKQAIAATSSITGDVVSLAKKLEKADGADR